MIEVLSSNRAATAADDEARVLACRCFLLLLDAGVDRTCDLDDPPPAGRLAPSHGVDAAAVAVTAEVPVDHGVRRHHRCVVTTGGIAATFGSHAVLEVLVLVDLAGAGVHGVEARPASGQQRVGVAGGPEAHVLRLGRIGNGLVVVDDGEVARNREARAGAGALVALCLTEQSQLIGAEGLWCTWQDACTLLVDGRKDRARDDVLEVLALAPTQRRNHLCGGAALVRLDAQSDQHVFQRSEQRVEPIVVVHLVVVSGERLTVGWTVGQRGLVDGHVVVGRDAFVGHVGAPLAGAVEVKVGRLQVIDVEVLVLVDQPAPDLGLEADGADLVRAASRGAHGPGRGEGAIAPIAVTQRVGGVFHDAHGGSPFVQARADAVGHRIRLVIAAGHEHG
ncbi:hypothetical protein D3C86_1027780 [compost metagenome]